jgi:hypothetical protein
MNRRIGLTVAAIVAWLAAPLAYADPIECQGTIVSEGDTEEQLLDACGPPTSRQGSEWRYDREGSLPVVVTVGNGMVMFIRDADELPDASASPLGDHP